MIAFVRGHFAVKTPAHVIVDVNGIGYDLQISLHTYSAISDKDSGQLHTYLHITENSQTFYGFAEQSEKEMFLLLISVSGIGAATARMMLSGMKPDEISKAIIQNNTVLLSTVKGIGKKTAERLVVELKDKLGKQAMGASFPASFQQAVDMDAVNALVALGIGRPAAEIAVTKIISSHSDLSLEQIIKLALKNL